MQEFAIKSLAKEKNFCGEEKLFKLFWWVYKYLRISLKNAANYGSNKNDDTRNNIDLCSPHLNFTHHRMNFNIHTVILFTIKVFSRLTGLFFPTRNFICNLSQFPTCHIRYFISHFLFIFPQKLFKNFAF